MTSKAEEGDGSEGGEESEVESRTVHVRALDVGRVEEEVNPKPGGGRRGDGSRVENALRP